MLSCISLACDFFRRVALKTRQLPMLLMWLVWSPADCSCQERKAFASDYLEMSASDMDASSRKIRTLFGDELREASETGRLRPHLWSLIRDLSQLWHVDTQYIEGMNNTIKNICKLANNIRWPLLSARLVGATYCRPFGRNKDAQSDFLDKCVEHHEASVQFFEKDCAGVGRYDVVTAWAPPVNNADADDAAQAQAPQRPQSRPCPSQKSVAKLLVQLKRAMKERELHYEEPSAALAYRFVSTIANTNATWPDIMTRGTIWIPCLTVFRRLWLCQAALSERGSVTLLLPLVFRPMDYLLSSFIGESGQLANAGDVSLHLIDLLWDRQSLKMATIAEDRVLLDLDAALSTRERRARRAAGPAHAAPARDEPAGDENHDGGDEDRDVRYEIVALNLDDDELQRADDNDEAPAIYDGDMQDQPTTAAECAEAARAAPAIIRDVLRRSGEEEDCVDEATDAVEAVLALRSMTSMTDSGDHEDFGDTAVAHDEYDDAAFQMALSLAADAWRYGVNVSTKVSAQGVMICYTTISETLSF